MADLDSTPARRDNSGGQTDSVLKLIAAGFVVRKQAIQHEVVAPLSQQTIQENGNACAPIPIAAREPRNRVARKGDAPPLHLKAHNSFRYFVSGLQEPGLAAHLMHVQQEISDRKSTR